MPEEPLLFEVDDDGVALITLNRPDKMNACSGDLLTQLADAYARCDRDDSIRAVVLTGAGRAFVAGADIASMADMTPDLALYAPYIETVFSETPGVPFIPFSIAVPSAQSCSISSGIPSMRYSFGIPIFLPLMSPVSIASKFGTASSALVESFGSWLAMASIMMAASRTVLVIGPA